MTELAKILGQQSQDMDYMKAQLAGPTGEQGSGVSTFLIRQDDIYLNIGSAELSTRGLGSSFILAHTHGLGWLGSNAGSGAVGSQPFLGDSRDASWTFQQSGVSMMFVTQGEELLQKFFAGDSPNYPQYMAIGSDSTTVTEADTSLGSEYETARWQLTSVSSGAGYIELEYVIGASVPAEQPCYVREFGIFDSSSAGSMYSRNTFLGFNKTDNYELQCMARINISGA